MSSFSSYEQPTKREQPIQQQAPRQVLDLPDRAAHGLPLPEQQQQSEAGEQDIGAAFGRRGHKCGLPPLESRPRHNAMLQREQAQ